MGNWAFHRERYGLPLSAYAPELHGDFFADPTQLAPVLFSAVGGSSRHISHTTPTLRPWVHPVTKDPTFNLTAHHERYGLPLSAYAPEPHGDFSADPPQLAPVLFSAVGSSGHISHTSTVRPWVHPAKKDPTFNLTAHRERYRLPLTTYAPEPFGDLSEYPGTSMRYYIAGGGAFMLSSKAVFLALKPSCRRTTDLQGALLQHELLLA